MRTAHVLFATAFLSYAALAQVPFPEVPFPGASTGGPVAPDGTPIQVELPISLHMKNTGGIGPRGPGSGSGLCVFTSIEMAARWQNVPEIDGLQKWMTRKPGGGYPSKVDAMLKQFCAEKGVAVPQYLQVEGKDLEILKLALKTGRMPSITTGYLPGYGGRIAHMTCLAHASGGWYGVLDNNYPGRWAWLSEKEFIRSYTAFGQGWTVVLLESPPPPAPKE